MKSPERGNAIPSPEGQIVPQKSQLETNATSQPSVVYINRPHTRDALLDHLIHKAVTHPGQPVRLSDLSERFEVSPERIRQLYHTLSSQYDLPPLHSHKRAVDREIFNKISKERKALTKSQNDLDDILVAKLKKADYSLGEIGNTLGISRTRVIVTLNRLQRHGKDTHRKKRHRRPPQELSILDEKVKALRIKGLKKGEMAKELGETVHIITNSLNRLLKLGEIERKRSY